MLKRDVALGGPSLRQQQRALDRFRHDYNTVRPHEALGQRPPAEFYEPSTAPLPDQPWGRDFCYPEPFEVARVRRIGRLPWSARTVFVSTVLRHQLLGSSGVSADTGACTSARRSSVTSHERTRSGVSRAASTSHAPST